MLEEFIPGPEYSIDGFAWDGQFVPVCVAVRESCPPPHLYAVGIRAPAPVAPDAKASCVATVAAAVEALGLVNTPVHARVILAPDGPVMVHVSATPAESPESIDLVEPAYGIDFAAQALRVAVGERPHTKRRWKRGAALRWFQAPSGIVTSIEGLETIQKSEGVCDLVLHVAPGQTIRHVADRDERDAVGHIITTGDTVQEAESAAKRLLDECRITCTSTLPG